MNIFYYDFNGAKSLEISSKTYSHFDVNDILLVKYYDQFKYIHTLEGKCIKKRKTKKDDVFVTIYIKSKNMYFSFFKNSPLVVSLLRKK